MKGNSGMNMTYLYSCRHSGDQYRITKFDHHFNVESSYLCLGNECECPAGHRHSCRHREMLPRFLSRGAVDTEWLYDYDRGGWVQGPEAEPPTAPDPALTAELLTPTLEQPPEGEPQRATPTIRRRV